MWNRRHCLRTLSALGSAGLAWPTWAQFKVSIAGVGATQIPIAVAAFRGEAIAPQPVSAIIRADLERCGLFRLMDAPGGLDERSMLDFSAMRTAGSDALAAGSVAARADGRYDLRLRLWDVLKGEEIAVFGTIAPQADLRLAAHRMADVIYEKLTGEKGIFATRIVYVTKGGSRYTLRVTDADGEGGQAALTSAEPIISPSWSPDGKWLAYVSFEDRKAVVWVQNVLNGQRRRVADFRGSNSAPAWSPDGSQLAVTLSREGGSQIFIVNREGGMVRRVTQSQAIDTEAVFTPDGAALYFVSDRGGGPQIYRQALSGGAAERVTFSGSYNISPALSPDGRTLAFVQRQGGGQFRVMTMDLASGQTQTLTDTGDDERPSFAPNGRLLIYATRLEGREVLMTSTLDGKIKTRLLSSGLDIREPMWGPFGR